jgi:hypothetical protein
MVLTPVFGAAASASCPFCFSFATTLDPINPVPPMTTIFMTSPLANSPSISVTPQAVAKRPTTSRGMVNATAHFHLCSTALSAIDSLCG